MNNKKFVDDSTDQKPRHILSENKNKHSNTLKRICF